MLDTLVWPLVVLFLSVFALLLFKKQFARLIDRTTTVSKSGIVGKDYLKDKELTSFSSLDSEDFYEAR